MPILVMVGSRSVTFTVPTPVLTAECRQQTSSLAPSRVTVERAVAGGTGQMQPPSDSLEIQSLLLEPVTSYTFTVLSYENIFGSTSITSATPLVVTTNEAGTVSTSLI